MLCSFTDINVKLTTTVVRLNNNYGTWFCLQAFREEIAPLRQDVRVVNELAAELTPLDIQLSSTASRQLDQLDMRWKSLQVILNTYFVSIFAFLS